jgi:hypothetical protein
MIFNGNHGTYVVNYLYTHILFIYLFVFSVLCMGVMRKLYVFLFKNTHNKLI